MDYYAGVNTALADFDLPNRLSGSRFDCVNKTITAPLNQQTCTVDINNRRRSIGCVVWAGARRANPNCLAGLLIKSHESMCAPAMLSPLERYAAYDYIVSLDQRRNSSTAMGG